MSQPIPVLKLTLPRPHDAVPPVLFASLHFTFCLRIVTTSTQGHVNVIAY